MVRKYVTTLIVGMCISGSLFADVTFSNKLALKVAMKKNEAEVVHTAFDIFRKDYQKVFGQEVRYEKDAQVVIGTIGCGSLAEKELGKTEAGKQLRTWKEGYVMQVKGDKLYILGSDKRGTAYGILELSRMIGVSPWEWWADSPVEKKSCLAFTDGFCKKGHPSVAHRGIFLNDEDWGLTPWSWQNYEPSDIKGTIGPKTHERIFELLLRLRANTFWPAMHACSVPFYFTPGNKEMADKYGIFIGTSHCEPMMRNANAEWKIVGTGEYDYVHNRENVLRFFEDRVKELAASDNIYTLGMRGVHDSKMQGANTLSEQKEALERIINDQREMLSRYINKPVEEVSQVFIPYKEVLDVYRLGLKVPEDVTLLWCDDNYGYIRHFPDSMERIRKGGNGVYYHVSYWGRPHDYLWLATTHPAQLYTQMKTAYDKGMRDMWILNVGDIKPAEYLTELFLDMAWSIHEIEQNEQGLEKHLFTWLSREFGEKCAEKLIPVMNEYYRLAYIRKPEFMGNTRTEEKDFEFKIVKDLPWSEDEIKQRIIDYEKLEVEVRSLSTQIEEAKVESWFQLVEYPVCAAAEMNKKHLYGQLARHGLVDWKKSDDAYNTIVALTSKYNSLCNGKWKGIMDFRPRKLAVFEKVPHVRLEAPLPMLQLPFCTFNGKEYTRFYGERPITYGMGYQRGAIHLSQGSAVSYDFTIETSDSVRIEIALVPNHPINGKTLRFATLLDSDVPRVIDYHTEGRSEEWKLNTLRNQAIKDISIYVGKGKHTLTIKAIDEGVSVDMVKLYR